LSLQPSTSPQPTLSSQPSSAPLPTGPIPSCNQQECSYRYTANIDLGDDDIFVDETFALGAVSFIQSIQVDIAAVYGEDLLILLYSPNNDEYVLMEDTRAIEGPERRNFDLGQNPLDPSLSNVAPYVFVETGGNEGFVAPYSAPGSYNAEEWDTAGIPYAAGDWTIFIEDAAAGDQTSIGHVVIRYCGVCNTTSSAAPAPSTSSEPSGEPSREPSIEPSSGPTVAQDTVATRAGGGRNRTRGVNNKLRH
jgi:subtilisin-like proprotein convertase family protein